MAILNHCNLPEELYYLVDKHVWARPEADGTVTVGITDVAQHLARQLVSATVKKTPRPVDKGRSVATLESGKWVGPVPAPVSGEIVAVNQEVVSNPTVINRDPYGEGWIVRLRPNNWDEDRAGLVTGAEGIAAYRAFLDRQGIDCSA